MRSVQVYIEGERLELFKDEDISIKSSQQSISDISKVMTDFSKSFSIPATPKNNAIMQHFYNSDVDATIDHNIHRDASIEIDLTQFREGRMSLDNATIKDNKVESYNITFFGSILSLKDKFGQDNLKDLDLSTLNHDHTATKVKDRITDGSFDYAIRYPLVTRRDLTYGSGTNDISHTGTDAIQWNELFPAVKLISLFNAIQTKYDILFSGTFFADSRFSKAFLHCQNANDFQFLTATEDISLTATSEDSNNINTTRSASDFFDIATNKLEYSYETFTQSFAISGNPVEIYNEHRVEMIVSSISDVNAIFYVDVYDNGNLIGTKESSGNNPIVLIVDNANNTSLSRSLEFKVRAESVITFTSVIQYRQRGTYQTVLGGTGTAQAENYFYSNTSFTLSTEINVTDYLPKMKVIDFFKGVLKMFNLTCYNVNGKYQIEPLDEWYLKGDIKDLTQYIDVKTMKVAKPPLYKKIDLGYKNSKSGTNTIYTETFGTEYGETSELFDYDGGDFKIELPFDNLMFTRFESTNLQVGKTIDKDENTYLPNPTIMYMYDELDADYRFNNGSSVESLTEYVPFGQDVKYNGVDYSLNFSADESTLLFEPSTNNLFKTYYYNYLSSLYNLKNRLVTVKAILPVSVTTGLNLNDRIVIRDKRYIINEVKSKITTGETEFQLMLDFREVALEGVDPTINEPIKPPSTSGCVDVKIILPIGATSADIVDLSGATTSISHSSVTEDTTITVCLPENTSGTDIILLEDGSGYIEQEQTTGDLLQEEGAAGVVIYTLEVTYNFSNGTTSVTYIHIQQQP